MPEIVEARYYGDNPTFHEGAYGSAWIYPSGEWYFGQTNGETIEVSPMDVYILDR